MRSQRGPGLGGGRACRRDRVSRKRQSETLSSLGQGTEGERKMGVETQLRAGKVNKD